MTVNTTDEYHSAAPAGTAAALIAAPAIECLVAGGAVAPFAGHHPATSAGLTTGDDAAVRVLAGVARLWAPGH